MSVIEQLNEIHCNIKVAAISRYDDEMQELMDAGVDLYSIYMKKPALVLPNIPTIKFMVILNKERLRFGRIHGL